MDPSPQTPPVAIKDGAGTAVTSGNATRVSTGLYSFALLPASTGNFDIYTATWTPTISGVVNTFTTEYEVVGGFLFSLTEARGYQNSVLATAAVYPDSLLIAKREVVEELFERNLQTAVVPRGRRAVVDGTGERGLLLPNVRVRKVNSITVDAVAYTAPELATVVIDSDAGLLQRTSGSFSSANPRNISVWFEYGYDQPPAPLKEAGLEYLRYLCMPNNEDVRVLSMANEFGTTRYATPGLRYPTGIPRVDAVLIRYADCYLHVG